MPEKPLGRGHYDRETGLLKISWTKIRTHEECHQKAKLVAEGKKASAADVRIFFPGNVVDQAMRRWLEMKDPPRFWMSDRVNEIMYELEEKVKAEKQGVVRWKDAGDRDEVRLFCVNCALRLEELLRQFALPYEYQPAFRFSTPMAIPGLEAGSTVKVLLVGEMDLLVKEKDPPLPDITEDVTGVIYPWNPALARPRIHIWDLKATANPDYWRKTVAQLVFYDIVVWCMTGTTAVEAGLLQPMVEGAPYISFVPSDQDRTEMLTRIVNVAHEIMRGDDSPKEGTAGCSWCETKHACVRYRTEPGTNQVALF